MRTQNAFSSSWILNKAVISLLNIVTQAYQCTYIHTVIHTREFKRIFLRSYVTVLYSKRSLCWSYLQFLHSAMSLQQQFEQGHHFKEGKLYMFVIPMQHLCLQSIISCANTCHRHIIVNMHACRVMRSKSCTEYFSSARDNRCEAPSHFKNVSDQPGLIPKWWQILKSPSHTHESLLFCGDILTLSQKQWVQPR